MPVAILRRNILFHESLLWDDAETFLPGVDPNSNAILIAQNGPAIKRTGMCATEVTLQRVREELAAERGFRRNADQERARAIAARQEAEERLWEVHAANDARKLSLASSEPTADPTGGSDKMKQGRRRGRPAKSDQPEAEFVEWWKPGWRDRFR